MCTWQINDLYNNLCNIHRAKIFSIMPKWNKQIQVRKNRLNMYYKYLHTSTTPMDVDKEELGLTAWLKVYIDYKIFKHRLGKMEK